MNDPGEEAMKEGVQNSKLFLAVITGPCINNDKPNDDPDDNAYFKRKYCLKELRWAIQSGVSIQPVIRAIDKDKKEDIQQKQRTPTNETKEHTKQQEQPRHTHTHT